MEVEDPYCLEASPLKLTFEDITSAAYKIKDGVVKTTCMVGVLDYNKCSNYH